MTQIVVDLSFETKLRADFFTAKTIRERIDIKRAARKAGYEELARELESAGFVPPAALSANK